MRVTHVVLSLDVGGLERGVLNQIREGRKLGQWVSVICLEKPGELAPQVRAMGVPLMSLDKPGGIRPTAMGRMYSALRALWPDVVHTHQIGTLFYAGPVAQAMGVPVVVHTEHGRENYAGRMRTRMLGRLAGLFTSRFYCLTGDMADHVRRHGIVPDCKIRVIENGIDMELFTRPRDCGPVREQLRIPTGAPVIGTVGRLSEVKQQDLLIRAFARALRTCPEAHLVLVGDGPLRQPLEALAQQLGVQPRVHFAGYQADTAPYVQMMNVFALTSRSEGMPQAALEASAAGVPVVASRVGGLPELIVDGKTGILFEPSNEQALVTALVGLITTPEFAMQMGQAAKARVLSRFHVRRMAAEYHQHFLELLGRGSPSGSVCGLVQS